MKSARREILASGPAGTGKTYAAVGKVHLLAMKHPGSRHLFIRKTRASLTESALVTFEQHILGPDHELLTVTPNLRRTRQSYHYRNGSEIIVGGMDNPERTLSTEYDTVYVQEVTELELEEYETLMRSLRHGKTSYTQLLSDCNPTYPHHWLYKRFQGDRPKLANFPTTHHDNPRFYDESAGDWTDEGRRYLATLDNMTGHRRKRFLEGVWAAAEGMVYEGFGDHNILPHDWHPPADWPRYHVVDFGFTNPICYQFWARDPDDRLYLYREVYRTQYLVEDLARWVQKECASSREPWPVAVIADHDAEDRATFERHSEIPTMAADKEKTAGIQFVQLRLPPAADGKPRLYIRRGCVERRDPDLSTQGKPVCTEEEFAGYVWDREKDEPEKENDHGMDACRYLVKHIDRRDMPGYVLATY